MPPFDPNAAEPKAGPKGKIGEYEIVESTTTFEDVGGNAVAKDLLTEVAAQFETPELYSKWDVPVPKGVLLFGEPGTGKTMLAKAFANKANAAFIEVPVASLRDKYYGESEKMLKGVFDEAAKYEGQVVIFFDEIDSLLIDRSDIPAGSPDSKIVNTFLQAMDGMQSATNVMVLGATNYPERLDGAATRPGRFDQKVEVELPDKAGCREIAAKQLLKSERGAKRVLVEDDLNLEEISAFLDGLTGADIAEVMNRVKRTMAQKERAMGAQKALPKNEAATEYETFTENERSDLRLVVDDFDKKSQRLHRVDYTYKNTPDGLPEGEASAYIPGLTEAIDFSHNMIAFSEPPHVASDNSCTVEASAIRFNDAENLKSMIPYLEYASHTPDIR